ncbi:MAG: transglycosylase, family [Candidatus Saccharibacteria bacterium]|nr:transglycosylase, family [Candidatus Saccharibacteria bacterium]
MALSYKNDSEEDERLNPATRAKDLFNQEQAGYDRELSDIENGFDKTADSSKEDENIEKMKNIDDVGQQEDQAGSSFPYNQTGRPEKRKIDFKGIRKKVGPLGFFGAILFGGGGLGLFFFSPGLLLVQMKEIFTNYGSSASRAAPARYNKMLKYTVGNPKVKAACASNPAGKKCTLGTMSEAQKSNYEKAGFKMVGDDVSGRTRITSIEFPDGTRVETGDEFISHTRKNVAAASAANKAHNPATKVFNGGRFTDLVLKRFGQTKSKEKVSGNDEKERKDSINKRTGNDISDEERLKSFSDTYDGRIKASANKVNRFTGPIAIACATYNIGKATIAAVKVANGIRFVSFAMLFLKVADQIKNQGDVDPETASMLGTVLTSTAVSGEKAGLAATDSQGYKIAAYGGEGLLKEFTRAFLLGGNKLLITIDKTIKLLQDKLGGRNNVKFICRSANDPKLILLLILLMCGAGASTGAVAGTIVPLAGNFIGALAGTAFCVGLMLAVAVGIEFVIGILVRLALPYVVEALANSNLDVNKISAVDAGNAMAVGSGVMLGTTALSRGLKAGNKGDVTTFLAATADDKAQMDRIAMYDSKDEPFNVYNEYSFLGSAVRKMGVALHTPNYGSEVLSNLGTIISSPLRLLTPNAGASPASMPVNVSATDLSDCPEYTMTEIGIDCDKMGQPQFVLSPEELAMEVSDNLDYMLDVNRGFHDENEDVVEGSTYSKWLANCTDQRETPMGATFMPIEDTDYDWSTGENCVGATGDGHASEEDLSNFRVYYNSLAEKEDGDYVPPQNTPNPSGGSAFRIASFNVLGKSHTDGPGADKPGFPTWTERIKTSLNVIKSNNLDVVAFQEFEPEQRAYLKENLPNYGQSSHGKTSDSIMWNTDRFTLVDKGTWKTVYFEGPIDEPWVKLKDNDSQQEFYVLSVHDPINKGQGNAQTRYENALAHKALVEKLQAQAPVLLVGDFNSAYTKDGGAGAASDEKLTYCVLAVNGPMNDAYDLSVPRPEKCPNKPDGVRNFIDHIYVSPEIQVDSSKEPFKQIDSGPTSNGSDHPTIFSDVIIPGSGGGATFNIASFNICYGIATDGGMPPCAKGVDYMTRLSKSVKVIKDSNIEVAGLQEMRPNQYTAILSPDMLGDAYGIFPKPYGDRAYPGQNAVIWKNDKFEFIENGSKSIAGYTVQNGGNPEANVQVHLRDRVTQQDFYIINMHEPVGSDGDAKSQRTVSANERAAYVKELSKEGIPIFLTGDFNSGYPSSTPASHPYCILTDNTDLSTDETGLWDAWDSEKDKTGKCPSRTGSNPGIVDHIYMSTDVKTTKYSTVARLTNGSDHNTLIAAVALPGGRSTGNVPSWTELPKVDAPIGGPVGGIVDVAVANIQKGSGVASSLQKLSASGPDFITLNEVGETSLGAMEAGAAGYGAYREPKVDGGPGGGQRSMDNAIMWRKDKWTLLNGGRMKVTEDDMGFNGGQPFVWDRWAAWGVFKRNDGAIVSVISTHMMTNPQKFPKQHDNPPMTRIEQYSQSMNILLQLTAVLAQHGPVLVGGDMNTQRDQGGWSAVPKMQAAGFGYANDGAVVYLFHPMGTKLLGQRNVIIESDHPALQAKINMNGVGPGAIK